MRPLYLPLAAALLLNGSLLLYAQTAPTNYTLLFSDDFTSTVLDSSKWNYRTDGKALSAQLPANVSLNSGYMDISLAQQSFAGYNFTGGGIVSKDAFRYGYYQVQAKITANPGWHSSFWVFAGNGTTTYTPTAKTEIDDFEINTDSPSSISLGYITWNNGSSNGGTRCNSNYNPGFSTAAGYHYYGFEWTESGITYYLDGSQICTQSYPASSYTHDLVNIWLTSIGYTSDISVANNPSPNSFAHVAYYVRDYYINALEPGYAEYGSGWTTSALTGFSSLPTRYSNASGATAQWTPTILTAGSYDVQIWKTQASSSDNQAQLIVNYSGGSHTSTVDFTSGSSGWVDLGTFSFAAGSTGNVKLNYSGNGYARTSMVKFLRQ
jgi:beta-glucanase (GH16 family)